MLSGGILFAYGVPAAIVIVLLGGLIIVQSGTEANVASAAAALPIGFAMAAGIVASVNPCGFFMLPTYIAYQLGTEEAGFDRLSAGRRTLRALAVGGTATAGFAVVFLAVGLVVAAGAGWVGRVFPFAGLGVGVLMLLFGMYLLVSHRYVGILAASRVTVTPRRNIRNAFVFGVGYAISSLACTLPIFLAVVGTALSAGGFLASFGQFASYALGMGIVIVAVTVGSALFRDAVSKWLRGALAARAPSGRVLPDRRGELSGVLLGGFCGGSLARMSDCHVGFRAILRKVGKLGRLDRPIGAPSSRLRLWFVRISLGDDDLDAHSLEGTATGRVFPVARSDDIPACYPALPLFQLASQLLLSDGMSEGRAKTD